MHTIDRATPADAAAMFALQQRSFAEEARRSGEHQIPPMLETQAAIAAHIQQQVALVARQGDAIVGAVRGVVEGGVCTVRALVVDPACQGRGIGSALVKALEAALPQVARFDLKTNMVMQDNVPFYLKHGYRVTEYAQVSDLVTLALMTKDGPARP